MGMLSIKHCSGQAELETVKNSLTGCNHELVFSAKGEFQQPSEQFKNNSEVEKNRVEMKGRQKMHIRALSQAPL